METLIKAKVVGGIGSLLFLPYLFPFLSFYDMIIRTVLIIFAMKYISDATNDRSIFNNGLLAMILITLGNIYAIIIIYDVGWAFPAYMMMEIMRSGLFLSLFIVFDFFLIGAIYLMKSFNRIAELLNVNYFRIAAVLFLVGSMLTIVLIGFYIILFAIIFMIIAFFSLPSKPAQKTSSLMPPIPI
jgi:uncharacterized membrane protein